MWQWDPLRAWVASYITPYWTTPLFILVQAAMVSISLILVMAFYTLAERKVIGWMQARRGPNRINGLLIPGLAQPFADVMKLLFKEVLIPADASGFLFRLAPFLALVPSLGILATPVVGIFASMVALDEPFDPTLLVAVLLIIGGIALGTLSRPAPVRPRN